MKKLGYLFSLFVVVLMFAGCQPTVSYSNFCTHCGAGYMSQDEADHCSVAVGCPYGYKSIPVEYYKTVAVWVPTPGTNNPDKDGKVCFSESLLSETSELRKAMENVYENSTKRCDKANNNEEAPNVYFTKEGYLKINNNSEKIIKLKFIELSTVTSVYAITDTHSNYYGVIKLQTN